MHKIFLISLVMITGIGCSSAKPENPVLPESNTSMKEVYDQSVNSSKSNGFSNQVLKRPATDTERSIDPYILHNTKRTNFRKLNNPTMYLFVNTHLSTTTRIPVPAYLTEFKLLERDEYSLPSETNLSNWR